MAVFRSALLTLSRNRSLRRFLERSRAGARLSSRFVAGTSVEDALHVTEAVNRQGMAVTLDSLGESVTTSADAHRAAEVYHRLLDAIAARRLNANISIKLTQMGLDLSPKLAEEIACGLAQHAHASDNFVRVDMEESRLTQVTLDIVRRVHARDGVREGTTRTGARAGTFPGAKAGLRDAIGAVIQAYLYRSQADIEQLLVEGIRVRLCKGAYNEPPEVAFPRKEDVDSNFKKLAAMLLDSPVCHAIATHDENMIATAKQFAAAHGIDPSRFEFQMLYGVRRDLQRRLVQQGYRVRVYVPFGTEWYPYFMRRLAERPANAIFLARNLFR